MILLATLMLWQPVDEEAAAIREEVQRFIKDRSPDAKTAILRRGAGAIRIVHELRAAADATHFGDLSELLFSLKFRDEKDPSALVFRDHVANNQRWWDNNNRGLSLVQLLRMSMDRQTPKGIQRLGTWLIDPVLGLPNDTLFQVPGGRQFIKDHLMLDHAASQLGLDWCFRHGALIVSTPARLWAYPSRDRALTQGERADLAKLIVALDADDVEERDRAVRSIPGYGSEAMRALREFRGSKDAVERAGAIIKTLEERYSAPAWLLPSGVERQTLDESGRSTADRLADETKVMPVEARFQATRLDAVLSILSRASSVPLACPDLMLDVKVTADVDGLTLRNALTLISKAHGFDFMIEDGRIVVDTREGVERRLRK